MRLVRVGILVSNKKWAHLHERGIFDSRTAVEYVRVRSLADLDRLDVLLSKISDFSNTPLDWVKSSPVMHITPFHTQRVFADRWAIARNCGDAVPVPPTYLIESSEDILTLPRGTQKILKTRIACGPPSAHVMQIVSSTEDGIEFFNHMNLLPLIAQTFIPHTGEFFKCFVIGERRFVFKRLDGLGDGLSGRSRAFSSAELSKAVGARVEDPELLKQIEGILYACKTAMGTDLFGADIVQHAITGALFVVDLNYFPSFSELGNFGPLLDEYCLAHAERCKVHTRDSGIDQTSAVAPDAV